jgi:2-aminoadipate transaminase
MISFARGVPSTDCLPISELADCARAAVERDGATILNYGPVGGYAPLREWIAERHGVEPARVLVLNGSLQGLALLAELLGDDGPVLVEAPTYDRPLKLIEMKGGAVRTIPLGADGIDVDALERELDSGPKPAFLYTIPTFQNPSGHTLGVAERKRLVDLARERNLLVVEDDPYGLVRFDGEPLPSLFDLAGGENVVFSSSFSKTVSPGIRVGYMVMPLELAQRVEARAIQTYLTPANLGQATIHEFLRRGLFEENVQRVSGILRERRDALVGALERELTGTATWNRPDGGYFLWLDLPDGTDARELLVRAEAEGVTFVPGSDFFPGGSGGTSSARLAYSFVTPGEIADGVARLARLVPAAASV